MTASYVLTAAAEADLRDIIRYTRKQWGDTQVRNYVAKLERGMERLAAGLGAFKDIGALYPTLRMARCKHHYIFVFPAMARPRSSWRFFTSGWI